jgi:hypothetical protein
LWGDNSKIAIKAREKREANERASILRSVQLIENLLDMLPDKPVYRLIREVLPAIKSQVSDGAEHGRYELVERADVSAVPVCVPTHQRGRGK